MASKRGGIHIRPYKGKTSDRFNLKTWQIVEKAMHQVKNHKSSQLKFEELYRSVYTLCISQQEAQVYQRFKAVVQEMAKATAAKLEAINNAGILEPLSEEYQSHFIMMNKIKDFFLYLDNMYCRKQGFELTFNLGLAVFRDDVVLREKINLRLHQQLLTNFSKDRAGEVLDRTILRATAAMLIALGPADEPYSLYAKHMESLFLNQTREHYARQAVARLSDSSFKDYLTYVDTTIRKEVERVEVCLDTMTVPALLKLLRTELLIDPLDSLFQLPQGVAVLYDEQGVEVFKLAYALFSQDDTMLARLLAEFQSHIQSLVIAACKSSDEDGIKIIQELLEIKAKGWRILTEAFRHNGKFQRAIATAFENGMNINRRAPEFLCLYMDDKLRRGVKELSDEQVDQCLSDAVGLFRHLEDKDVFEKQYKLFLSKRLLLNKSASDDAEASLLAKLKVECGHSFTTKMEGMFRDINLSHTTVAKFKEFEARRGVDPHASLDFSIQILNPACWPKLPDSTSCTFPPELQEAQDRFENFYHKQHTGRKLIWQPAKGTGEIVALYTKKQHIFVMSTSCLVVLLQFNNSAAAELSVTVRVHLNCILHCSDTQLSCVVTKPFIERRVSCFLFLFIPSSRQELETLTTLESSTLKRTLQSLACGKHKILTKSSTSKSIATDDTFKLNESYHNKMIRVKVQQVAAKVKEERAATTAKVKEERKLEVEAAIVRVMKARKTLSHTSLIIEVTKVLSARFKPNPVQIKKRIESLIDRDYLARDESDRSLYNYVA
eukprot:TRINITY_DN8916_c0_g1_i6.p1 TRINITY_DN8916_c0_g1~~TRINITY_DN8916_c0_g1_i6.p1  ORF type:complete len:777 (+),score=176.47 TRINITY_DN8916_c0_g1_i6:83-2413(+)